MKAKNQPEPTTPQNSKNKIYSSKNDHQRHVLQSAFDETPNWTYAFKMKLAGELKMTVAAVAKWNWDMRKKNGLEG